ncbi:sulfotransferase family protein [Virgibacillus siamensis]|uniref:sulfotransferase family protein n=1 Tax=Virgibacillus siamensis TaxID=480071 RepID=UPI0009879B08|nr:sulfotransferase [Virgibacillus siamensis]
MALLKKSEDKRTAPYSKAVTILGSGRCGTSMASRSVNLIGVDLGEGFVKPNKTNPKGFWEHRKIVNIHKDIKKELGPYPFPKGWKDYEEVIPHKQKMKSLLVDEFSGKALWGWKDPRTTESLAMWKEILSELNVEGNFLLMIRNPVDVAASFKRAYNRKEDAALNQWQIRTLLSLKNTVGQNRIIIDYDDFIEDSFGTLKRISDSFSLPWTFDENRLQEELDSFIDPTLRHSRTTLKELDKNTEIDKDIKKLYKLALKASHDQEFLNSSKFSKQIDKLYNAYMKKHG